MVLYLECKNKNSLNIEAIQRSEIIDIIRNVTLYPQFISLSKLYTRLILKKPPIIFKTLVALDMPLVLVAEIHFFLIYRLLY